MRAVLKNCVLISCLWVTCQVSLAENNKLLTGTWSSACASDDAGNFNIETFVFSGNSATYSVNTYRDSGCKHAISKLTTYRIFKLGRLVPKLANTRKLDYTFKSVTMTYTSPAAVAVANKNGDYGSRDWTLNLPKNVSGLKRAKSSSPEHAKGEKFYTLVQIHKNKLYMGDYGSGTGASEKGRLSTIYNVPFIKQK